MAGSGAVGKRILLEVLVTFLLQATEMWTLAIARVILTTLVLGFAILSFLSYRREKTPALKRAVGGFLCIALGLIIEILYVIFVKGSLFLTSLEIIRLQLVEGGFLIAGFLLLLYAISGY